MTTTEAPRARHASWKPYELERGESFVREFASRMHNSESPVEYLATFLDRIANSDSNKNFTDTPEINLAFEVAEFLVFEPIASAADERHPTSTHS
jgi:hypothetical protein